MACVPLLSGMLSITGKFIRLFSNNALSLILLVLLLALTATIRIISTFKIHVDMITEIYFNIGATMRTVMNIMTGVAGVMKDSARAMNRKKRYRSL